MSKCQGGKSSRKAIKDRIMSQLNELKAKNIEDEQRKEAIKIKQKEMEEIKKKLEIMRKDTEEYIQSEKQKKELMSLLETFIAKQNEPPIIIEEGLTCTIF